MYCELADTPKTRLVEPGWQQVVPNMSEVEWAMQDGDLPNVDNVAENYRGLCVSVSDHGNVSLLMRYRNGNTREIWGCV
ncbi:MAG: hypothetical protein WC742_15450 [Gallionellaceae bacterium]